MRARNKGLARRAVSSTISHARERHISPIENGVCARGREKKGNSRVCMRATLLPVKRTPEYVNRAARTLAAAGDLHSRLDPRKKAYIRVCTVRYCCCCCCRRRCRVYVYTGRRKSCSRDERRRRRRRLVLTALKAEEETDWTYRAGYIPQGGCVRDFGAETGTTGYYCGAPSTPLESRVCFNRVAKRGQYQGN